MPPEVENPQSHRSAFFERVLNPRLNVNSGVYTAIDPDLSMRLNEDGEYEYVGLDDRYVGPFASLLKVSALGGEAPSEQEIAEQLFPVSSACKQHPVIGNYRGLYAGFVAEPPFRDLGSSGGIGTWLLTELLRTGRIDGVIHMRPNPGKRPLFSYHISKDAESVAHGAKSHYYPGALSDALRSIAREGGRYAVTAIPSFAYELRLLQQQIPEFKSLIPYIIGLVCGHQKTANYADQLAWRSGIAPGSLESIDFRKKDLNASASRYLMEMTGTVHGERVSASVRQGEVFGSDWGLGLFKSNFSDFSEDALNETADIVLGDAWLPRYVQDGAGTNIVITRNEELHDILIKAWDSKRLNLEEIPTLDVLESQSALLKQTVGEIQPRYRYVATKGRYVPPLRRSAVSPRISLARTQIQRVRFQLSQHSHLAWQHAVAESNLAVFDRELAPLVKRYRFWQRVARLERASNRVLRKVMRRDR